MSNPLHTHKKVAPPVFPHGQRLHSDRWKGSTAMATNTNAPESAGFTAPELQTFAAARDAVAHMSKTFEQWILIARAVEIARRKADEMGGRSTFERILNQQGLAHALGNNWSSQKNTASKLLKILGQLPGVEAWRASLSRSEQFSWAAPTTIYKHCPLFATDKPERRPAPKADIDAIGEVTADLRKAADDIVTKTSGSAQPFDLSSPEMIEESAKNFVGIYREDSSAQFANAIRDIQQTKPAELQEDRLERCQARTRLYLALAWYQGMRATYFKGMLEGKTGATSGQLEQRYANSPGFAEYGDKAEAAYEEMTEWEEGEEEDIAVLMPEVQDENEEDEDDDSLGPHETAFIDEIWKEARKAAGKTRNPIIVPELVTHVMERFPDANQGLVAMEFIGRCRRARGIVWEEVPGTRQGAL
jgi:hypothetical protein